MKRTLLIGREYNGRSKRFDCNNCYPEDKLSSRIVENLEILVQTMMHSGAFGGFERRKFDIFGNERGVTGCDFSEPAILYFIRDGTFRSFLASHR